MYNYWISIQVTANMKKVCTDLTIIKLYSFCMMPFECVICYNFSRNWTWLTNVFLFNFSDYKKNENKNTTVPVIKSKQQDQLAAQGRAAANKTVLLKSL